MKLSRVTPPAQPAYHVPDLLTWLNVVRDDEVNLVEAAAAAAQSDVETYTDRVLITQIWDVFRPAFGGVMVLPYPPVQAVESVTYLDLNGGEQTLAPSAYETWLPTGEFADPGEIRPAYLQLWPETRATWNAVRVRIRCGYGNTCDDVPVGLRKAIDRLTEEMYRIRGVTISSTGSQRERPVPSGFSLERALMPYRVLDAWWRPA